MTTVVINDQSRIGKQLLHDIGKHPRVAHILKEEETFAEAFEREWQQAIPEEEMFDRLYRHIDELFANGKK
jgi:pantoate kinase